MAGWLVARWFLGGEMVGGEMPGYRCSYVMSHPFFIFRAEGRGWVGVDVEGTSAEH